MNKRSSTRVVCGRCGRVLDERSDTPVEQRQLCPVCGSTARVFDVGLVAFALSMSLTSDAQPVAEEVAADALPEAATIRGTYQATLEWCKLAGGTWLLHVRNEQGVVIDGGIGDNTEDALFEVYERLIPPK